MPWNGSSSESRGRRRRPSARWTKALARREEAEHARGRRGWERELCGRRWKDGSRLVEEGFRRSSRIGPPDQRSATRAENQTRSEGSLRSRSPCLRKPGKVPLHATRTLRATPVPGPASSAHRQQEELASRPRRGEADPLAYYHGAIAPRRSGGDQESCRLSLEPMRARKERWRRQAGAREGG